MNYEERLKLMTKGMKYTPRHCSLACEVLEELKKELESRKILCLDDGYWPYHVVVPLLAPNKENKDIVSLFCGGFRKTIDAQQLKGDGTADNRFKEISFSTPKGAANYIVKRLNKEWKRKRQ